MQFMQETATIMTVTHWELNSQEVQGLAVQGAHLVEVVAMVETWGVVAEVDTEEEEEVVVVAVEEVGQLQEDQSTESLFQVGLFCHMSLMWLHCYQGHCFFSFTTLLMDYGFND